MLDCACVDSCFTLGLRTRPFIYFVAVVVMLVVIASWLCHPAFDLLYRWGLVCEGVTICMLLICVYEDIQLLLCFNCICLRKVISSM